VVDAEGGTDAGPRVNVDAGFAVGKFADQAGTSGTPSSCSAWAMRWSDGAKAG
jgi:hypothetical protein